MNFAELFVHNRVLAYMLSLATLLFGLIGFNGIGVDRVPDVDAPLITITTASPGSSPATIDDSITSVLESAVNSVSAIYFIRSISSPGLSMILMEFELDKDIDAAFNEVQAKVNQVVNELPTEAEVPVVAKLNPTEAPVVWLVLQGDRELPELNRIARDKVKKNLENIYGVGEVVVAGGRERKLRVDLDLRRMAALEITVDDVIAAFGREHLQLPGGYLVGGELEKLLHLDLEYHSSEALEELVIAWRDRVPVKLLDIARVSDGLDDMRSLARLNGREGVSIAVRKVQNTNTVELANAIERRLEEVVRPLLPDGVQLTVAINEADIIEDTVAGLQNHILEGTLLAALVVWLFLLNLPATLIITAAIPVSLAAAIFLMYFNGYTFNVFTLSGLLLLIGVVVDDAIVVLENIHRQHESGVNDHQLAAVRGTQEVVFPVLAASLSLVCIFASVIFMGGLIGSLIRSFAVVVTAGVIASMLISLSLTPALCAQFFRAQAEPRNTGLPGRIGRWHQGLERQYRRLLGYALGHRGIVLLVTVALILSTGWFFRQLGSELFPRDDESRFLVSIETPLGSSIHYVLQKIAQVEQTIQREPGVAKILSTVEADNGGQVNKADLKIMLTPVEERNRSQFEIMGELRTKLAVIPGVDAYVREFSPVAGFDSQPLMAYITGPELAGVAKYSNLVFQRLRQYPGIGNLKLELELDRPMLSFKIDRARAQELGISTRQVGNTVRVLAGGADIAKYSPLSGDGERYDVRLAAQRQQMEDIRDLEQVYLRTQSGSLVTLGAVTAIEEELGPANISRMKRNIGAGLTSTPQIGLGDATAQLRRTAEEILPPGYDLVLYGESDKLEETSTNILFAFVAGLALVYMVLASQFNSFLQPLLVMLAQPLAIIGGVIALWLTGHTLNIYSMIGLFLLVGLVSKNSILLIDLINRYRREGMAPGQAILEACPKRMRPVLMTSLTIVLAMLPSSLGIGEGSGQYGPLAVAVIGGIVSSTALTLVVIPVAYSLLARSLPEEQPI